MLPYVLFGLRVVRSLTIYLGIIGSAKKIIDGYIEVIRKKNKCLVIGFSLSSLISADGILGHIEIHCHSHL